MKHILYLLICSFFPFIAMAQLDTTIGWGLKGGVADTHAKAIEHTLDGKYIFAGATNCNTGDFYDNHGSTDALVEKAQDGGIYWQKCLGGSNADAATCVKPLSNGDYIVGGTTFSNDGQVSGNHGNSDAWLVKLDALGNILWQKCFGGSGFEGINSLAISPDGGFIFTALTTSFDGDVTGNSTINSCWIVKTDSLGNILWQFCPAGVTAYLGSFIQTTGDNGFIIAAACDSTVDGNHGNLDYLLLKLDSAGNVQWQKSYGSTKADFTTCVQPLANNNGYIVTGNTQGSDGDVTTNHAIDFPTPWVIKLDASGNLQWQKLLDSVGVGSNHYFSSSANAVKIAANNSYLISGNATGFEGASIGWVAMLDSAGIIQRLHNTKGAFYDAQLEGESGLVAAGDIYEFVSDTDSTYVYKYYILQFKPSALLPVTVLNFSAAKQNNTVLLQWLTAAELNTSYFNVQRSADAEHFITVGKVTAAGNSVAMHNYSYTDNIAGKTGAVPVLYYRLQEVDKDGKTTLSKIATVVLNSIDKQFIIMPNPVKNSLTLQLKNYAGKATFTVYDIGGHKLLTGVKDVSTGGAISVNTSALAAGAYIVTVSVNGNVLQQKFVKE